MENNRKLFPLILFIAIAGFFVTVLLPAWTAQNNTPTPTPGASDIQLTQLVFAEVDFGDQEPVQVTLEEGTYTAFSALVAAVETMEYELQTQQYDFGVFVQSINGYESTAEQAWVYSVNGESGMVAADQMQLNPGDTVTWKYVAPIEE